MKKSWKFVLFYVTITALTLTGAYYCKNKDKEEKKAEEEKIAKYTEKHEAKGKYIYKGNDGNIHACKCLLTKWPIAEKGYAITYVDTTKFIVDSSMNFCIECVTNEIYEWMQRLSERNKSNQ